MDLAPGFEMAILSGTIGVRVKRHQARLWFPVTMGFANLMPMPGILVEAPCYRNLQTQVKKVNRDMNFSNQD